MARKDKGTEDTADVQNPVDVQKDVVMQAPRMPVGADLPQSVTLEAFCKNRWGKQVDQAGGFLFWARKAGHVRHTVPEWLSIFEQFNNRPCGAQK